jgi:hypothetical protein
MAQKTISQYVPVQPGATQYVQENFPVFLDFVKVYYEWMEQNGNVIDQIFKLPDERNVDLCLSSLLNEFSFEFLNSFPSSAVADRRLLVKLIKQFYRAKGSEQSFKFLFRALYNVAVEFYYPKTDILRLSDGKWNVRTVIRTTPISGDLNLYANRIARGLTSGATAYVERIVAGQVLVDTNVIDDVTTFDDIVNIDTLSGQAAISYSEIQISHLQGVFNIGETIEIILPDGTVVHKAAIGLLTGLNITNRGKGYRVNDVINPTGSNLTASLRVNTIGGNEFGHCYGSTDTTVTLSPAASAVNSYYNNLTLTIFSGTGAGQSRVISAYNGSTKIATVAQWQFNPDSTSRYQIVLGQIKSVKVVDFGLNYSSGVSASFSSSATGSGAVATTLFGAVGQYAGSFTSDDGFVSDNKFLQDNYYYQEFSYVLKTSLPINTYRDIVHRILHPISTALFGIQTNTPAPGRPNRSDVPAV